MVACAPFGQIGLYFSAFFHVAVAWFAYETMSALRWRVSRAVSLSLIVLIPIIGALVFLIVNRNAREFLKEHTNSNEQES
jgi:hypothetical protein